MKLVHELNDDHFVRGLKFCKIMSEQLINNQYLFFNICFSDESSYFLNGLVNRHDLMQEESTQHLLENSWKYFGLLVMLLLTGRSTTYYAVAV